MKETSEVGPQHLIPFLVFHENQQVVFPYPGIVDQGLDILPGMCLFPFFQGFSDGFRIGDVKRKQLTFAPMFPHQAQGLFRLFRMADIVHQHIKTHGSKL